MKIKNTVCTIEQGKRLKALGITEMSSIFSHICVMPDPTGEKWYYEVMYIYEKIETLTEYICDAFTSAELNKMLPYSVKDGKGVEYILSCQKEFDHYSECESFTAGYYNFEKREWQYGHGRLNTAECFAQLLITCLEQGNITANECNERLAKD